MQGEWYEVEWRCPYNGWQLVGYAKQPDKPVRPKLLSSAQQAKWRFERRNGGRYLARIIRVTPRGREVVDG